MVFIFGFDPDGIAIGSTLVTLSPITIAIIDMFGNIIWLMGVVWLVFSIIIVVAILDLNNKQFDRMSNSIDLQIAAGNIDFTAYDTKDSNGIVILAQHGIFSTWIMRPFVIFLATIGIGSGFWFTGTSWLVLIVTLLFFLSLTNQTFNQIREHHLKETDEESEKRINHEQTIANMKT
jgi:hypothetical protein